MTVAEMTAAEMTAAERTVDRVRRVPGAVGAIWALLLINTLGSAGAETVVRIPRTLVQVITMGALVVAFGLALALNPRVRIRPSAYLLLLSLLLVTSVIASASLESGFGAVFRCIRLAVFLATLWLLTRWWGQNLAFVRYHVKALTGVLASVVIGIAIAPGLAFSDFYGGRLVGALWPIPPTQVGQYSAVVAGLMIVLWLGRRTSGWSVLAISGPAVILLLLTHTRTATLALAAALVVAGLSLALVSVRARRAFTGGALFCGLTAVAAGPVIVAWFRRGQDVENLSNLTGRQKVWDALLAEPRSLSEHIFGIGLTNKSYGGLPIDNSWLAIYYDQGVVGVVIIAVALAVLLVVAVLRNPSVERGCALFLIVYCVIASYTEAGLGDASPYVLHLALAAGLLARGGTPAEADLPVRAVSR